MKLYVVQKRIVLPHDEWKDELVCIRRHMIDARKIADRIPGGRMEEWDTEYLASEYAK